MASVSTSWPFGGRTGSVTGKLRKNKHMREHTYSYYDFSLSRRLRDRPYTNDFTVREKESCGTAVCDHGFLRP